MTREENLAHRRAMVTDYMHRAQAELEIPIEEIDGVDVDKGRVLLVDHSVVDVPNIWGRFVWDAS